MNNQEEHVSFLYRSVYNDRNVDILGRALESSDLDEKAAAKFVLSECAGMKDLDRIYSTIAKLAYGDLSDKSVYGSFLNGSMYFDDTARKYTVESLGSAHLGIRNLSIRYLSMLEVAFFNLIGKDVYGALDYTISEHGMYDDWSYVSDRSRRGFRISLLLASQCRILEDTVFQGEDSMTYDYYNRVICKTSVPTATRRYARRAIFRYLCRDANRLTVPH